MNGNWLRRRNAPRAASRTHKILVSAVLLLGTGFAAWAVAAHPPHAGAGMHPGPSGGHGPMRMLSGRLDLSDEQRERVRAIIDGSRTEAEALHEQLDRIRQQVADEVRTNGYREDQVRAMIDANLPLLADSMLLRIRTMADIYAVLTPAQQAEADELFEKRGRGGPARWRGRHGRADSEG